MNLSRRPKRLLLQWHITDKCNLRCSHCYQADYKESGLEFQQLLGILDQYEILLSALGGNGTKVHAQINITGGEPFVRNDFLQLLQEIRKRGIPFAILTNGTLIDRETARFLKALSPRFIQLSLEGTQTRHDAIRGSGNYASVMATLKLLKKTGLRSMVSFTAHRDNFREFPAVADQCRLCGVSRLWSDRLIPLGAADGSDMETLSPQETNHFFTLMAAKSGKDGFTRKAGISMHRALQFLVAGEGSYRCSAGHELITVMPDGTVFPCRRLPIPAGNLFRSSLTKIYLKSEILRDLRDPTRIVNGCEACEHAGKCGGGLRCLAYAMTGDPYRADPGCWLATPRV
jgi:radical SAM protein with 4Fe4S-binding SPASM domain